VLDVEIGGTVNTLNAAANNKVKKFIFGSSSEVYGDSQVPLQEGAPFSPKSTYAAAKLLGEEYCKAFYQKYGMPYTILRYFNVYGPRQDGRFVISRFMRRALANESIHIYGDGKQTRDFTHVDDAVNMTLLATINNEASCQTINIGTGISTSINDLAFLIMRLSNHKNPIKYVEYNNKRPREIEVFSRTADITKARKLLRYKPNTSLESGTIKLHDLVYKV
jgi:UDP-glucose 4-epimerase